MNYCEYSLKVSELIDGQLESEEIEAVRMHLAGCPACREMHQCFLESREQIRILATSVTSEIDERARDRIHRASIGSPASFWTGSIRIPVPVAAVLTVILIGIVVWTVSNTTRTGSPPRGASGETSVGQTRPAGDLGAADSDIARFDRGGRAVMYKERRSGAEVNPQ